MEREKGAICRGTRKQILCEEHHKPPLQRYPLLDTILTTDRATLPSRREKNMLGGGSD